MHILVRFASFDSALKIERQEDPELIDVLTPFDCLSCMLGAFQSSPQSTTSDPMSASPRDLRDMSEETIKCLLQGQYDSFRRGSQRDQMAVAMLECGLLDDVVESIGCVHAEVLRCSEELDDAPREGAKRPGTVAGVMGMTLMELLAKIAHTSAAAKVRDVCGQYTGPIRMEVPHYSIRPSQAPYTLPGVPRRHSSGSNLGTSDNWST